MTPRRLARAVLLVGLVVGLAGPASAPAAAHGSPRPPAVVFDTDMDFDDAAALAYLVARHKADRIRLRAVIVESDGAQTGALAVMHARCLLRRLGMGGVPVGGDPARPARVPVFPSLTLTVTTIMSTLVAPCPAGLRGPVDGVALMAQIAREERNLRILATGPLTTLARVLEREPAVRRAKRITVNGGEIDAPADPFLDEILQRDGTQHFNFSADPRAAATVVAAGLDSLLLVTTNATDDVPMTPAYAARLRAQARTPEARFVADVANHPLIVAGGAATGESYWWDPFTAVAADDPGVVAQQDVLPLIVRVDGRAAGRTEVGGGGAPVRVALRGHRDRFEDRFLRVLNGG